MVIKQVAFYSSITSIFYILIMFIVWADSFETGGSGFKIMETCWRNTWTLHNNNNKVLTSIISPPYGPATGLAPISLHCTGRAQQSGNGWLWSSSIKHWYWGFCTSPSHLSSDGTHDPSNVIAQTPRPQPGNGQVEPPGRNPSGVLHPNWAACLDSGYGNDDGDIDGYGDDDGDDGCLPALSWLFLVFLLQAPTLLADPHEDGLGAK